MSLFFSWIASRYSIAKLKLFWSAPPQKKHTWGWHILTELKKCTVHTFPKRILHRTLFYSCIYTTVLSFSIICRQLGDSLGPRWWSWHVPVWSSTFHIKDHQGQKSPISSYRWWIWSDPIILVFGKLEKGIRDLKGEEAVVVVVVVGSTGSSCCLCWWLIDGLMDWRIDGLMIGRSFGRSVGRSVGRSIDRWIDWLIDGLIDWLIDWLIAVCSWCFR